MYFKDGKWAKEIINSQHSDGSWGYFHSLATPISSKKITTEQALRRLENLGYTINDEPIKKAIIYLDDCLLGKNIIPDTVEKDIDWKIFTELMIATWIRKFTLENKRANNISCKWASIVENSIIDSKFDPLIYDSLHYNTLSVKKYKRTRTNLFMNFYQISLVTNALDKVIEPIFFKHLLNCDTSIIYFNYIGPLKKLPETFLSKNISTYIRQMELLSRFENIECKQQLQFFKIWLEKNKINEFEWDMGVNSKDNILFPLSDSWKKEEDRIKDCTYIINKLIKNL